MPPIRHGSQYVAKTTGYSDSPYEKPMKKKDRKMKAIFKNHCISLAGSFISPTNSKLPNETKKTSHDQVVGWITAHGGKFQKEVEDDTTHLVCSIEEYKNNGPQVQKAKAPTKQCQIVVLDWIVDSLLGLPEDRWVKKLKPASNYLVEDAIWRVKKAEDVKDKLKEEFESGVQASKELADSKLHHIYFDTDGFQYKVTLTRVAVSGSVETEKYTLYLFESHAKPSTYMFGAKYNHNRKPTAYFRQHLRPMIFASAFVEFKKFFKGKTGGIDWDDRLEGIVKMDTVFTVGGHEAEHRVFRYTIPKLGQATGVLPYGYVRPEYRAQAAEAWEKEQRRLEEELFGESESDGDGEMGAEVEKSGTSTIDEESTVHSSELEANVPDYGADLQVIKGRN